MQQLQLYLKQFTALLQSKSFKVVTAESCTGGMLAQLLTDAPGSSAWFESGFVTYSLTSKMTCLQVPETLLQKKGAVSVEVAKAMAEGALKISQAEVAIAITGIAGPTGGSVNKPVGLVCFGFAHRTLVTHTEAVQLPQTDRARIRLMSCSEALRLAYIYLTNGIMD